MTITEAEGWLKAAQAMSIQEQQAERVEILAALKVAVSMCSEEEFGRLASRVVLMPEFLHFLFRDPQRHDVL